MRSAGVARTVLLILVTAGAESALAQDAERRGFVGLGIGPSAPFAAFADASPANARSGRAVPGYTDTFLNVSWRAAQRFGVAGAFSYSEYFMRDGGGDDWWQVAGVTVGPMYSRRLAPRAAIDLKAMVGMIAMTPVIDSYTTADGTGAGVGLDVRATIRYDAFRRWAVFADIGVQSSPVSFATGTRTDYRALISGLGVAFRPTW